MTKITSVASTHAESILGQANMLLGRSVFGKYLILTCEERIDE